MPESRTCSRCGAPLSAESPGGHCLPCLLQLGLQSSETAAEASGESTTHHASRITNPTPPLAEKPGDRFGHYKLLQQIGEGGCGVVYMAEQEQPVRRRVALKIIKLGMDTRNVIARFEAERQALAMMDHPNIAKVFDAGATEAPLPASGHPLPSSDEGRGQGEGPAAKSEISNPKSEIRSGRPYFVMELVRGVKITTYCDQQKLSTRQRLDLFIQVCQAVQHAHQKGIIHRDLKPSNILVTEQDGAPVPKIIDFGIAKATTDQRLTDKTLFTAFEQFIGTPAYMSPEQAGLGGLDIDTRSDIYSLGVLLYELLTGQPPFDSEKLARSALDEILRTIRENEPPRPSARLTTLTEQELTTVAQRRQTESAKLPHLLRGDLDWIVMKALDKDRRRRYETANGFAHDIERFLHNEAITARPPSNLYRFQKAVRRNKLAFAAGAGIAAALLIGLCVATWALVRERDARNRAVGAEQEAKAARNRAETNEKKAQTEAAKSQQVAQFLTDMLAGAGPEVAKGRDATILLEILKQTTERIGRELTNQPAVKADLLVTIAGVYDDLGQYANAEVQWREALAISEKLSERERPIDILFNNLALTLEHQGKLAEAEDFYRKALTMRRKILGKDDLEIAVYLGNLATILRVQDKLPEARPLALEAVALLETFLGDGHPRLGISLHQLGEVEWKQGDLTNAEAHLRAAIAIFEKAPGAYTIHLLKTREGLASVLSAQNNFSAAESLYRETLELERKLLGDDHPDVLSTLGNLAANLNDQGKLLGAEKLYRETVEKARKGIGGNATRGHPRLCLFLAQWAGVLLELGQLAEARSAAEEAVNILRQNENLPSPQPWFVFRLLGNALAEQGNLVEAEAVQSEMVTLLRKRVPAISENGSALAELAVTLIAEKKFGEAESAARQSLEFREKNYPDSWRQFSARVLLGESLLRQKKHAEAEPLLISGYEGMEQRKDQIPSGSGGNYRRQPRLKRAIELLVQLYEETARPDQAAGWKQKLAELEKTEVGKRPSGP